MTALQTAITAANEWQAHALPIIRAYYVLEEVSLLNDRYLRSPQIPLAAPYDTSRTYRPKHIQGMYGSSAEDRCGTIPNIGLGMRVLDVAFSFTPPA